MRALVASIDPMLFWGLVVGWALGLVSAWKVTSLFARLRDAIAHARHHWAATVSYLTFTRENIGKIVLAGGVLVALSGMVAALVWLRLTAL